jgi:hypothetical protein
MTDAADYRRIIAEGRAAEVGTPNPYNANLAGGSRVKAVLWLNGYRAMVEEKIRSGPAHQRYLRARAERAERTPSLSPCTLSRSEFLAPPNCAGLGA